MQSYCICGAKVPIRVAACRATSVHQRERYLTPLEYRRIGIALREDAETHPAQVAIIRLLLFTGARVGEIQNLRWEWVQPPRLGAARQQDGAENHLA